MVLQHVQQLSVVYLHELPRDLPGQVWTHTLDQREEALAQLLLLLLGWSGGQHGGGELLLALDEDGLLLIAGATWLWGLATIASLPTTPVGVAADTLPASGPCLVPGPKLPGPLLMLLVPSASTPSPASSELAATSPSSVLATTSPSTELAANSAHVHAMVVVD